MSTDITAEAARRLRIRLQTEQEAFSVEADALAVAEYVRTLRADIERDEKYAEHERAHHNDWDLHLAERKASVEEQARSLVESDKARAQHEANVNLARRLQQARVSQPVTVPTSDEVAISLDYFGATEEVWGMTYASMNREDALVAVVRLHRDITESEAESAEREANALALRRVIEEQRMSEYASQRATELKMEG